jgi:hypothetical protein
MTARCYDNIANEHPLAAVWPDLGVEDEIDFPGQAEEKM